MPERRQPARRPGAYTDLPVAGDRAGRLGRHADQPNTCALGADQRKSLSVIRSPTREASLPNRNVYW